MSYSISKFSIPLYIILFKFV